MTYAIKASGVCSLAILLWMLFFPCTSTAQPARKGWMGANGSFSASGFAVDTVSPGSTLQVAGVKRGDTIVSINSAAVPDAASYNKAVGDIRAGDPVSVAYRRGGVEHLKRIKAVGRPLDTSAIADVIYDWVPNGQCTLRTIVRKPKGKSKVPAVLLIPGYNCGSIENFTLGSYGPLIQSWLTNGFAVVTIEKSGIGDSYNCQPCMEADLVSDMQVFDAGYKYMEQLPYVDNRNLFIWGHSMGGIVAPEIAKAHNPRGVIVFATVFRPWSEFLLEMHRVQYPLDGKSYAETEKDVRMMQKLYYELFVMKKSPEQIHKVPEYAPLAVRELEYKPGSNNMWGRHWRFWQQIDSFNMAESWGAVKCPVLSIFGGADFIACSELEHQLITNTVNAAHPGNATHITIPDIDHLLIRNPDWKSAHVNFSNKAYRDSHFHQGFADTVNSWMKRMVVN